MYLVISPDGACSASWYFPPTSPSGVASLDAKFKLKDSGAGWTLDIPPLSKTIADGSDTPHERLADRKPREIVVSAPMRGEYTVSINDPGLPPKTQILTLTPLSPASRSREWKFKRILPSDADGKHAGN
jgi:hypothetical protein